MRDVSLDGPFYVLDLRPEWRGRPALTFWRPKNAGYAYPLSWSGRYEASDLKPGYHVHRRGRRYERFAVPCSVVEGLAEAPPRGLVDGDAGPVVLNSAANLRALRKARYRHLADSIEREAPHG